MWIPALRPRVLNYVSVNSKTAHLPLVSFAAVFRLVTQRSSPQTAAFFRTTFLSLCLSVQAIDQSYYNYCLKSNQSHCSKKTFPRDVDQRKYVPDALDWCRLSKILDKNFQFVKRGRTDTQQNIC